MRILIAAFLLFLGVPQGAPPTQTGAIEGKVVRASNSEAISGVQVMLVLPAPPAAPGATGMPPLPTPIALGGAIQIQPGPGGAGLQSPAPLQGSPGTVVVINGTQRQQITVVTDSDGKFAFPGLAPGDYILRASRDGYFGPMSPQGQYAPGVTKTITVESSKTAKVDIGMVQGGVLRGVARDPDGQPAPNYAVVTARPGYTNTGRAVWLLTGARNADDRGEYRWPGFAPGEYYVGVGPRAPGPIANVQDAWARVFYPGVIDPNQGRTVTIPEGGEVTVNLSAQLKPWGSFKISGVAINPLPNLPPDPATGVVSRAVSGLVLMPLDLTPLDNPPITQWTNLVATNTKPNGEFVLTNVDPGRYELYAMAVDNQNRRVWTGHLHIEVKDKDITGLSIPISPGVTLRGEIALKGSATVGLDTVRVSVQALDTLPPQVASIVGAVPVDENGKFQVANLSEGRYRLNVTVPPGSYVETIQQGGVNVFDDGFTVDAQTVQVPLRIEIDTAGETVEGNVRISAVKEAPNAMVVLVPSAARRNNPAAYKTAVTDDKGHFVLRGVPSGAYTAFAWEAVFPGAYQNADFLNKYQSRGRVLNVQRGSRSDLQLDLIQGN